MTPVIANLAFLFLVAAERPGQQSVTCGVRSCGRYVVVRGLTGAGASGVAAVAFLVATEPVGPTWRGAACAAAAAISAKGAALLPALGWALPYWRGETFAAACLTAAFLLCLLPSVPESPRWLLHRGRKASLRSHALRGQDNSKP